MRRTVFSIVVAASLAASASSGLAQSVANGFVSYQGVLEAGGTRFNGTANLQFRLFVNSGGGTPLVTRSMNNVAVADGLVNAEVEFGQASFANQADLWLEVAVQAPAGVGPFVTLTPRQRLTSSVFAMNTRGVRVDAQGRAALGTQSTQPLLSTLNLATTAGDSRVLGVTTTAGFERWTLNYGSGGELAWRSSGAINPSFTIDASNDIAFNGAVTNPSGFGRVVCLSGNPSGNSSAGFVARNVQTGTTWSFGVNTAGGFSFFNSGPGSNVVSVPVLQITGGSDIAEPYDVAPAPGGGAAAEPGMLVVIDADRPGALRVADAPYDRKVAGIISGANGVHTGLTLTQERSIADGSMPIAKVGRVWALADADANGPIEPGDQLTTASTPGHAMRADPARAAGCAIGKAMSRLDKGRGYVLVLVNLN